MMNPAHRTGAGVVVVGVLAWLLAIGGLTPPRDPPTDQHSILRPAAHRQPDPEPQPDSYGNDPDQNETDPDKPDHDDPDQEPPPPPPRPEEPVEVDVRLRTGTRLTGLLARETPEEIVIRVSGVETRIPRESIAELRRLPPLRERYREIRDSIAHDDIATRLMLVDWCEARELYAEALYELELILLIAPNEPRALQKRQLIRSLRALQVESIRRRAGNDQPRESDREPPRPGDPEPPPGSGRDRIVVQPPRPTAREREEAFGLISNDDINILRIYETDLRDPPRLVHRRDLIDTLIRRYGDHEFMPVTREGRQALYRLPSAQVLDLLFRLQARDLYAQIQVLDHPRAFALFRNHVHADWLMNSCATARCHGGQEAGRLWLWSTQGNSNRTVYSNFLVLERFRLEDGTPLIDYTSPARSPLLQMGLPREDSLYPHPPLPGLDGTPRGWRPVFERVEDRKFRQAVEWINAMYRPRPDYPVDFQPPNPRPARGVTDPYQGER
ncbi:MAG: hypothetical protein EA378_09835 [Phycisphaerales bacterium]|nr:MAG: hypothetical protein EA378_09835 [Phycisphaerales bacterium]